MKKMTILFAFLAVLFIACDKDSKTDDLPEAPYEVEIDIIRPEPGAASDLMTAVGIEVEFKRNANEIIHNVLIEVIDENGNVDVLFDEHVHEEGIYTYINDQGYSPAIRGEFTLRATSSDMQGTEVDPVEVNFFAN